jgi:Uma2 family endonuclease
MGMVAPIYYTAEMVRALPDDGNRYEVVYGELLVSPAPRLWHQELTGRLFRGVGQYLEQEPVGHLLLSPADISWGPDVLVQPDLFVAPLDQVRTLDWSNVKDLLLVVEVLSPSTTRADRFTKRRLYQERRVPVYWVVDGDQREVEVWTPETRFPVVERERVTWHPAGAGRPFILDLQELFRPI